MVKKTEKLILIISTLLLLLPFIGCGKSNGGKITFCSYIDGHYEIYVMNADGSDQTRLTNNDAEDTSPVWSPDSTKIAFVSDRDGNDEIYVMNANGSNQTRLTDINKSKLKPMGSPVWSSDGRKIAFTFLREQTLDLYVMNADGYNLRYLNDNYMADFSPIWSPDSTKIAFVSDREGNGRIHVMNVDGSNDMCLSNNEEENSSPAWSPDGNNIAYVSIKIDTPDEDDNSDMHFNGDIYIINVDSENQKRLTNNTATDTWPVIPLWSPASDKIAFIYYKYDGRDIHADLYVINADGSNQRCLVKDIEDDTSLAWSPDGSKIVFESHGSICVINADGSNNILLTENGQTPDW